MFDKIILLILILFFSLYSVLSYLKLSSLRNEIKELNDELTLKEKIIRDKEDRIIKLRTLKHDKDKHIKMIQKLIEENQFNHCKNYISSLEYSHLTSKIDTSSFLITLKELLKEECEKNGIIFKFICDNSNINLPFTDSELHSIISNIISNSIDALNKYEKHSNTKYICLDIFESPLSYCIKVRNNGPKIENTNIIFNRAYTTNNDENRGYGLYIVKSILEKYNSNIYVDSNDINTIFTILIPK